MNALQYVASGCLAVAAVLLLIHTHRAARALADTPQAPSEDLWTDVDQRRIDAIRELGREGTL